MSFTDCPKRNFRKTLEYVLGLNNINDLSKFEVGFDAHSNMPMFIRWEYVFPQPTVENIIQLYTRYKEDIKNKIKEQYTQKFREENPLWPVMMQKYRPNKTVELDCLKQLYPELFE